MDISRRDLLKWAAVSATAIGLGADNLSRLERVLAAVGSPPIIWLQGASCSGCSVSLLNATSAPIETVLTQTVSMKYHPNLSAAYGEPAVTSMFDAATLQSGKFILCVEGGIPTGAGGKYCVVGERKGVPLTMLEAVRQLGPKAKRVVAVGTCASFGGVVKPSRFTGIQTVSQVLAGRTSSRVVNLPGCPAHPDTVLGALVAVLSGATLPLDSNGRPTKLFAGTVHSTCPRRETEEAQSIGRFGCYEEVGCQGPETVMSCPATKWNGGRNWCVNANQACIGCASPSFPTNPLLSGSDD
jgi:hydrogenase small subunit